MNIHRKDRAKLRQFSEENLLSLDIAKAANPSIEAPNIVSEDRGAVILESSVQEKICTPKSKEEKMTRQLGESSSSSSHIDQYLDLELRLGPEPREASASRIDRITNASIKAIEQPESSHTKLFYKIKFLILWRQA